MEKSRQSGGSPPRGKVLPLSKNVSPSRLPAVDGLRGISITMVVFSHMLMASAPFSGKLPLELIFDGSLGVRIFFVLSGFIITYILMGEKQLTGHISLPDFYKRRFVRLLPALAVYVFSLMATGYAVGSPVPAHCIGSALGFLMGFVTTCGWDMGHLWSLSVEELFYLIWPVSLIFALKGRMRRTVFAFCLVALAARIVDYIWMRGYFPALPDLKMRMLSNFDHMVLGAYFAHLYTSDRKRFLSLYKLGHARSRALAVTLILVPNVLSRLAILGKFWLPFGNSILAFGVVWLMGSLVIEPRGALHRLICSRFLVKIGLVSYSLYLWQEFFFDAGGLLSKVGWAHALAVPPLNLAAMLGAAFASYYFVELPTQSLARRLGFLKRHGPSGTGASLRRAV